MNHFVLNALSLLRQALPALIAFALICAAVLYDLFAPMEHALMDARFRAGDRPATGNLIIVEIDAKSLREYSTWPWPRQRHAELIDALTKAGAARIAFDVDFSSRSTEANDAALASAIARAGGRVILPAFGQRETTNSENTRTMASEPLPAFREHALIGHVNIWPLGSLSRTVRAGVFFGDIYRPAMAALVSEEMVQTLDERYIDFSIDPFSIPRISFTDVVQGNFSPDFIRGRTIIVGGTAIELGDRLPVPVFGVLPGVTVQALAAESMTQGRSIARTSALTSIVAAFLIVILLQTTALRGWVRASCSGVVIAVAAIMAAQFVQDAFAISTDLGAPLSMLAFGVVWATTADLRDRAAKLRAERARSAARQALIRRIVEESSDGILAVDTRGSIVISNARAAAMFGSHIDAVQGHAVDSFLPLSAAPFQDGAMGQESFPFAFEHTITRPGAEDGTVFVEAVVNRSICDASLSEPVFVVTLHDITLRKRMEEAERRAAEERLIAERSKSLFIANMSHELRTPLNAIIGFSEIIEAETLGGLGNKKYKEYAGIVLKSGQHLLEMVNNVLEISRLESGGIKAERRQAELLSLIDSSFAFIRNSRDYDGQVLRAEGVNHDLLVQTDVRLFKQIMANLLSNSIKFAKPGTKATATVTAAAGADRTLVVTVADDGAGMSPETLSRVTDLFFQGDGTFTRKHEGRGLGLYLVKKHVEILGGTLAFESELGVGTRVIITLPNAIAQTAETRAVA